MVSQVCLDIGLEGNVVVEKNERLCTAQGGLYEGPELKARAEYCKWSISFPALRVEQSGHLVIEQAQKRQLSTTATFVSAAHPFQTTATATAAAAAAKFGRFSLSLLRRQHRQNQQPRE